MTSSFRLPKALALLLATALCVSFAAASRLALIPGDDAPSMRGYAPDGERVVVRYEPGTVTLINYWATWCEPCKEEMPALSKLYERRRADGMQVYGVHVGYVTDEDLGAFLDAVPVGYPILRPDERWLEQWGGIAVMPTTFLVDGQGKILRHYIGATAEQIEALIYDATAALEGRALGPIVIPETPNVATEQDRPAPPPR